MPLLSTMTPVFLLVVSSLFFFPLQPTLEADTRLFHSFSRHVGSIVGHEVGSLSPPLYPLPHQPQFCFSTGHIKGCHSRSSKTPKTQSRRCASEAP